MRGGGNKEEPHPSGPPPAGHCMRCGYDLRGIDSQVCPECGLPKSVPIGISDSRQFHIARAALEGEGLLIKSQEPIGGAGLAANSIGAISQTGWLWVSVCDLERVEACLDEAGVASSIGAQPIVDRSEPNCPKCNSALDPHGREQCPQCGALFQWVEIDESELDPE